MLQGLQQEYSRFKKANTEILAISVDPIDKNKDVRKRLNLEFEILSDTERKVTKAYKLSHDTSQGIIPRPAEYLIDGKGKIVYAWLTENFQIRTRANNILAKINEMDKKK